MKTRPINKIILHCSATDGDVDIQTIDHWHRLRGWTGVGYHFLIRTDGTVERGRDIDVVGAHCKGQNADSIGICYAGGTRDGKPFDTMTEMQEMRFIKLVDSLRDVFGPLPVHGHNEFAAKACPSFNVQTKFKFLNHGND